MLRGRECPAPPPPTPVPHDVSEGGICIPPQTPLYAEALRNGVLGGRMSPYAMGS